MLNGSIRLSLTHQKEEEKRRHDDLNYYGKMVLGERQ